MSNNNEVNTNISDYTSDELLNIIGLTDETPDQDINNRIEKIISKYTLENNTKYIKFFLEVKNKLLENIKDDKEQKDKEDDPLEMEQATKWLQNQFLTQTSPIQRDRITNRQNNVQIFDGNTHATMKRETLGINNTIPLSIAQDSLNPVLRQKINRHITIDSQYRANSFPYSFDPNNPSGSDTNFTCTLSEPIKNVLNMKLSSFHIPPSWYTFDPYIGNTCFYIKYSSISGDLEGDVSLNDASCAKICILQGNYNTVESLVNEINFDLSHCPHGDDLSGLRIFIQNHNVSDKILQFINYTDFYLKFFFYDPNFDSAGCTGCGNFNTRCTVPQSYKQNLGYYLGFRILEHNTTNLIINVPPISHLTGFSTLPLMALRTEFFACNYCK